MLTMVVKRAQTGFGRIVPQNPLFGQTLSLEIAQADNACNLEVGGFSGRDAVGDWKKKKQNFILA